MKILRNIFIGFGVLFFLIVLFFFYMGMTSTRFKEEHTPFVTRFMTEFSEQWEVWDVRQMVTNEFVEQLSTPDGQQAMAVFRQLGRASAYHDIELRNFKTMAGADSYRVGEFFFKADFENAGGLVTLTIIVNQEGTRVHNLHIIPTDEVGTTLTRATI